MKKFSVLFALTAILAVSCNESSVKNGGKAVPDWVGRPPQDKIYKTVVGFTEDMGTVEEVKAKALANAKAKLSSYIFEETSVKKVFTTSGALNGDEDLQKSYRENIESESAARLTGVEIVDSYSETTDDGGLTVNKVWVLTRMSQTAIKKERSRILSELKRKLELVESNIRRADSALSSGQVIDAVKSYISAAISAAKVENRQDEYIIYINKAGKILDSMYLQTEEVPKSVDISGESQVSFKVYFTSKSGPMAVSGAKVNFVIRNNKGDYTRSDVSSDGLVACKIDSLREVNLNTSLYATLSLDFQELLDLGGNYKKSYSTLKSYTQKVTASASFKTVSGERRKLPTAIIALVNDHGKIKRLPSLAAEMQSLMLGRGYKVVKASGRISSSDLAQGKPSALRVLQKQGIKRIMILQVSEKSAPKYNKTLERYKASYSLASQLMDTKTGEVLMSKNTRVTPTADSAEGVMDAFIKASGRALKRLID